MSEKKALIGNAGDPEQVRKGKDKVKFLQDRSRADVQFLLSTAQGRRFIWRYLEECGVYRSSVKGVFNPSEVFFYEGRREIGLKILADVHNADPEAYTRMINEAKTEEKGE